MKLYSPYKNRFNSILLMCISLIANSQLYAQKSNAYIYIELIKTIPCKIIQNEKEIIQYNKNYVLLYGDENSEQKIDIEFGANLYPKQSFIIDLKPNNAFAYKLAKSSEQSFYLLDLINNGKIIESNSNINIAIATELNALYIGNDKNNFGNKSSEEKKYNNIKKNKKETLDNEPKQTKPEYGIVEMIPPKDEKTKTEKTNNQKQISHQNNQKLKTGCNQITLEPEINSFIEKLNTKRNDEDRLILVRRKQFSGCLATESIIQIISLFSNQYYRFETLKALYPLAAYPNSVIECESLFRSSNYKLKLAEFLKL